jgi:hypothetical protein
VVSDADLAAHRAEPVLQPGVPLDPRRSQAPRPLGAGPHLVVDIADGSHILRTTGSRPRAYVAVRFGPVRRRLRILSLFFLLRALVTAARSSLYLHKSNVARPDRGDVEEAETRAGSRADVTCIFEDPHGFSQNE